MKLKKILYTISMMQKLSIEIQIFIFRIQNSNWNPELVKFRLKFRTLNQLTFRFLIWNLKDIDKFRVLKIKIPIFIQIKFRIFHLEFRKFNRNSEFVIFRLEFRTLTIKKFRIPVLKVIIPQIINWNSKLTIKKFRMPVLKDRIPQIKFRFHQFKFRIFSFWITNVFFFFL